MDRIKFKSEYLIIVFLAFFIGACRTSLSRKIFQNSDFSNGANGFYLKDLESGKVYLDYNGQKYFMPASNTKLVTFYAANKLLEKQIPAFAYEETSDSVFVWGMGDPSFLHPDFKNSELVNFIAAKTKPVVLAKDLKIKPLGTGWAWDDYPDYYSAEVSELPIFGNVVHFSKQNEVWKANPSQFLQNTYFVKSEMPVRDRLSNLFFIHEKQIKAFDSPFIQSHELTAKLLSDLSQKKVGLVQKPISSKAKLVAVTTLDSLLKLMLYHSDNMIAEQLVVEMGRKLGKGKDVESMLMAIQDTLTDAPLKNMKWVDGSGLSRYNLMKPMDLVNVLEKIYQDIPKERWMALMPKAGGAGTLKNVKLQNPNLEIWAKSGSFSNTYNLSGFAKTPKGKWIAFSIMTNLENCSVSKSKEAVIAFLNNLGQF